ncbi:hypothetical protein HDU97_007713 [Phlyctochytrium planicorne]|nr:hypothetical protein HDU97_007713 [Phlyctochytrium planicorne]
MSFSSSPKSPSSSSTSEKASPKHAVTIPRTSRHIASARPILPIILILLATIVPTTLAAKRNETNDLDLFISPDTGLCSTSMAAKYNVYCPNQVIDICLRVMAIMMSLGNAMLHLTMFSNRFSSISILTLCTFLGHALAVFCSILPYARITAPSVYLTVHANVGLLLLTSETFQWLLYLRLTSLLAIRNKWVRWGFFNWMCLESVAIIVIYGIWAAGAQMGNNLRKVGGEAYSYACIVQAGTGLVLSGYFIFCFFFPRLRGLKSRPLFFSLFTSGLVYLLVETFLQTAFTLFFRVAPTNPYYTGLNQLCTAIRHGIFLLFVHCIRDASATGEKEREFERRIMRRGKWGGPPAATAGAGGINQGRKSSDVGGSASASVGGSLEVGSRAGLVSRRRRASWSSQVTVEEDRGWRKGSNAGISQTGVIVTPPSAGPYGGGSGRHRANSYLTDGGDDEGDRIEMISQSDESAGGFAKPPPRAYVERAGSGSRPPLPLVVNTFLASGPSDSGQTASTASSGTVTGGNAVGYPPAVYQFRAPGTPVSGKYPPSVSSPTAHTPTPKNREEVKEEGDWGIKTNVW